MRPWCPTSNEHGPVRPIRNLFWSHSLFWCVFIFIFFKIIFYINIFSVSHFTVLYPYRPAGGGRDLYVNKYKLFLHGGPCWEPAAPLPGAARWRGGRQPASRLPPPPNIKVESLPSHSHFLPTRSREGRGGVRKVIPPCV